MTCSASSTLTSQASALPSIPGLTGAQNQALSIWAQNLLMQIQGAAGATGVNVVPQQYALLTGATLPPIVSVSNCAAALDATKPLFGQPSYKITITGSPATIKFSADTAWPLHPGWQWIVSFFQQASSDVSGVLTITTPDEAYTTDFDTTLAADGFERLFDTLNLGADSSSTFGLSFTFTGGTGQTVWLNGLMMEPYYNVPTQPSPFISTSSALTLDNQPDGFTYVKLLGSNAIGNVAYNYKGVWSSATAYIQGDEVVYGSTYWLALAPSTNSAPSSTNANWQAVGTYGAFEGAWSSVTSYTAGAEVTYGGNFWLCVTANTNSAPTTSNPNWQIAGPTSLDDIADGTTYARVKGAGLTSGVVNTNGIVAGGVSGYDFVVDVAGSQASYPHGTNATEQITLETVNYTSDGGWVEITASANFSLLFAPGASGSATVSLYMDGARVGTMAIAVPLAVNYNTAGLAPPFIYLSEFIVPSVGAHIFTLHATFVLSGGTSGNSDLQWTNAVLKVRELKR